MKEIELTFLARRLPPDLLSSKSKEMVDIYFPKGSEHPKLRLRKNGSKHELTKKQVLDPGNFSIQEESTIDLTEDEYNYIISKLKTFIIPNPKEKMNKKELNNYINNQINSQINVQINNLIV